MFTRRECLVGTTAAALGCGWVEPGSASMSAQGAPGLRELGADKGIEIGSAFSGHSSEAYRQLLATHCDVIAPEWQLKPRHLKPRLASEFNFSEADDVAEFCRTRQLKLHGHTLFWNEEPLRWAERPDWSDVKQLYGTFLATVVSRYPQAISWDVFNEIVDEQTVLRPDFLIGRYGYQFIDYCLRVVHEQAPAAALCLNDYNLECAAEWCSDKRANMLEVIKTLKRMETPIHAIGVQAHLQSKYPPDARKTLEFIRRVEDLGLVVYFSELDVNDSEFNEDVAVRDRQVADYYYEFLAATLQSQAVKRLMFWGISDSDNWVVRGETGEHRPVGTARPALFGSSNEPKAAFHAVVQALSEAPKR